MRTPDINLRKQIFDQTFGMVMGALVIGDCLDVLSQPDLEFITQAIKDGLDEKHPGHGLLVTTRTVGFIRVSQALIHLTALEQRLNDLVINVAALSVPDLAHQQNMCGRIALALAQALAKHNSTPVQEEAQGSAQHKEVLRRVA